MNINNYDEKIDDVQSQFMSALDDYKKYFVYFNKNPEVDEFENYYSNSKSQLQSMSKQILSITNEINNEIDQLNDEMKSVSVQLDKEKTTFLKLSKLDHHFENTQNGSEILIDDVKHNYNVQYRHNWELFLGVIMIGGFLYKSASKA